MAVSSTSLATLDEIKSYSQIIKNEQSDNDILIDLSDRITVIFQNECGVTSFKSADYIEHQDGQSSKYMFLNNSPINSISEINEDSDWSWASDTTIGSDTYRIIDSKYIVMKDGLFTQGYQNFKIIYNAGYAVIPLDLKQVCIEEVIRRYKHRKDFDVVAKSLEDGNVTYTEKGLLTGTKKVLEKYINRCIM